MRSERIKDITMTNIMLGVVKWDWLNVDCGPQSGEE